MANVEKIRTAISNIDGEVLKDTLAILLSSGNGSGESSVKSANSSDVNKFDNFAQAISWLKKKYKFQELEAFSTEADLVYVNTGDRRILLTDTTIKPREIKVATDDEFAHAWEPVIDKAQEIEHRESTQIEETPSSDDSDIENAFEPLQKKGRFTNLEL